MDKTKLIWFAFLGSIGIYGAVPLFVAPASDAPQAPVAFALVGASVLSAALSFIVPTLIERTAAEPRNEGFAITVCVLRWVCVESVAIFGLVLFVLGHGAIYAWGFAAAAGVLMVVHAPRAGAAQPGRLQDLARPDVKIG